MKIRSIHLLWLACVVQVCWAALHLYAIYRTEKRTSEQIAMHATLRPKVIAVRDVIASESDPQKLRKHALGAFDLSQQDWNTLILYKKSLREGLHGSCAMAVGTGLLLAVALYGISKQSAAVQR